MNDASWKVIYIKDGKLIVESLGLMSTWRETMDIAERYAKEVHGIVVLSKYTANYSKEE
jgi:hypothetical protein